MIKEPLKEEGPEFIFKKMKENEFSFDELSAKFSVSVEVNKAHNNLKGVLRLKKDSLIWLSLNPGLGMEMVRLLVETDSVRMLNRFQQTYFNGDIGYINEMLQTELDFDILQAFITGNDFMFYENNIFKASVENKMYKLTTMGRRKLKKHVKNESEKNIVLIQNIHLDPDNFRIIESQVKEIKMENRKFIARYSDFRALEGGLFPFHMEFEVAADEKILIIIDFSKVNVETELKYPFRIPRKYKRIQ